MNNKNTIFIGILIVIIVITVAVSLTYAFIGRASGTGNILSNTQVLDPSESISLTYEENKSLNLSITLEELSSLNSNNNYTSYIETDESLAITLTSDSSIFPNGLRCVYEIRYEPVVAYRASSGATANSLKEFTIQGTSSKGNYFSETSIANVTSGISLNNNVVIATTGTSTTTADTWTFKMRFYNLDVDQTNALGQSPSGKIVVVPGECEKL